MQVKKNLKSSSTLQTRAHYPQKREMSVNEKHESVNESIQKRLIQKAQLLNNSQKGCHLVPSMAILNSRVTEITILPYHYRLTEQGV